MITSLNTLVPAIAPTNMLAKAQRAVPAVKWALGIVGIGAAAAILVGLFKNPLFAAVSVMVMIVLMAVFYLFANIAVSKDRFVQLLARVLATFALCIFIVFATCLSSSALFGKPIKEFYLGSVVAGQPATTAAGVQTVPDSADDKDMAVLRPQMKQIEQDIEKFNNPETPGRTALGDELLGRIDALAVNYSRVMPESRLKRWSLIEKHERLGELALYRADILLMDPTQKRAAEKGGREAVKEFKLALDLGESAADSYAKSFFGDGPAPTLRQILQFYRENSLALVAKTSGKQTDLTAACRDLSEVARIFPHDRDASMKWLVETCARHPEAH